jgi:hypothetical protein
MIGRDIVSLLQSEARRRPVVADLLARVDTLSDQDIEQAQVPLKWYKDALREARKRSQAVRAEQEQAKLIDEYAKMAAENPLNPDDYKARANAKRGITLEYTGDNFWAKCSGRTEFEIRTGDWLFFPEDGSGAWLNQTFFPHPPKQLAQSRKVGDHTQHEYVLALQSKMNQHPDAMLPSHEADSFDQPRQPFRIYKTPGNYW